MKADLVLFLYKVMIIQLKIGIFNDHVSPAENTTPSLKSNILILHQLNILFVLIISTCSNPSLACYTMFL